MLHGMRFDSGKIGVNLSEFFPSTILDVQKPNPNIVVKLTNTNPMYEAIKFTEIEKVRINNETLRFLRKELNKLSI